MFCILYSCFFVLELPKYVGHLEGGSFVDSSKTAKPTRDPRRWQLQLRRRRHSIRELNKALSEIKSTDKVTSGQKNIMYPVYYAWPNMHWNFPEMHCSTTEFLSVPIFLFAPFCPFCPFLISFRSRSTS
jgi:hypothetical protein